MDTYLLRIGVGVIAGALVAIAGAGTGDLETAATATTRPAVTAPVATALEPAPAADAPSGGAAPAAPADPGAGPPEERPGKGKGRPSPPDEEPTAADPSFSVPEEELAAALACSDLTDTVGADRTPILLVHGTFTWGEEQFGWSWLPELDALGRDWCVVTYPDRGFGDLQVSAEYVAHAVLTIRDTTGRRVDMAGHSQGALMPRWALKYWPSVNAAVDDFVMLAGPNHGTAVAGSSGSPMEMPEAFWQMRQGSAFVTTLNEGDESPGSVSYTSLYTWTDELVQPSYGPDATAPLAEDDNVTNLALQEACPGRVVDHLTIGTTDRASFLLTLAAFDQDGPLDVTAVDLPGLCKPAPDEAAPLYDGLAQVDDATGLPFGSTAVLASGVVPEPFQRFASAQAGFDLFLREFERGGMWDWHQAAEEPEIQPYAR